jgi:hypothetical protein
MHRSWEQLKAATVRLSGIDDRNDIGDLAEIVEDVSTYFDDADPEAQPERHVASVFLNELEQALLTLATRYGEA